MLRTLLFAVAITVACCTTCFSQSRGPDPLRPLSSERLQDDLQLTPLQRQRVRQLMMQWEGPKALLREDVARQVGLSKQQRDSIKLVYDSHDRLDFEYFKMRRIDRDQANKLYKQVRESEKTLEKRALSVLSQHQLKRFDLILGKRFDRSKLYEPITPRPEI